MSLRNFLSLRPFYRLVSKYTLSDINVINENVRCEETKTGFGTITEAFV